MSSRKKIYLIIASGIFVILLVILYFYDPDGGTWLPKCPWHLLTGTSCPSCGNTRLVYHLMHGEVISAWKYNYFSIFAFPVFLGIVYTSVWETEHALRWKRYLQHRYLLILYIVLFFAWWVLRNIFAL